MSFPNQIILAFSVGLIAIVVGVLLATAESNGWFGLSAAAKMGAVIEVSLAIGLFGFVFLGLFRLVHRWQWHHGMRNCPGAEWLHRKGPAGLFWRWWVHVDREGNDLDGTGDPVTRTQRAP